MSSPKPPPAPDYAAAAQQTAAGNASQAQVAQYGSMTNQVTPYGRVTYTATPAGKTKEGDALNQWTQTVSLSPSEQAAFEQNNRINAQLGNVAESGVGYVQQALANPLQGQQYSGNIDPTANQMVRNVNAPTLQGSYGNNAGQIQTQSGANQYAQGSVANNANQFQTSVQDPNLLNQQVQNALYQNATQYLDPQFKQSNAQLANRLANQGITQGSEAYNNAMLNAGNAQQQAYESARNNAVSGGINAAQGMFGMNLQQGQFANQALGQQFGQNVTNQQLGNSAAAQNNQMMLANQQAYNQALGQQNTQNMGAADFANQAAQAQYGMGMQNAALQNQAAQQAYQQALQSGQFQNQTAAQKFAQAQALQQNPLNMLNATRTGQQMQVANIPNVGQSNPAALQAVAGPDMLGAATALGQYNMNTYNQQAAANNSMMGGLMQLGGQAGGMLAGGMFSDRRLKKNIKRIGTHALGIGLYTWDYLWGQPFSGVMADEVEKVMPEAVGVHPSGFKWVNYKMLGLM